MVSPEKAKRQKAQKSASNPKCVQFQFGNFFNKPATSKTVNANMAEDDIVNPVVVIEPNNHYGTFMITPQSTYHKLGYGPFASGFIDTTNPTRETNAIRCVKTVLSYFNFSVDYKDIEGITYF